MSVSYGPVALLAKTAMYVSRSLSSIRPPARSLRQAVPLTTLNPFTEPSLPSPAASRSCSVSMMQRIEIGQLRILSEDGIYQFPPPSELTQSSSSANSAEGEDDMPKAEIRVLNERFWIRLMLLGDLGFSEAFMFGDAEVDDLAALFRVSRPEPHVYLRARRELRRGMRWVDGVEDWWIGVLASQGGAR